jgi:hypothetical protein
MVVVTAAAVQGLLLLFNFFVELCCDVPLCSIKQLAGKFNCSASDALSRYRLRIPFTL